MGLTMIMIPAALVLALWGGVMAVSGLRQRNKWKMVSAVGAFAVLAAGASVMAAFITRPL